VVRLVGVRRLVGVLDRIDDRGIAPDGDDLGRRARPGREEDPDPATASASRMTSSVFDEPEPEPDDRAGAGVGMYGGGVGEYGGAPCAYWAGAPGGGVCGGGGVG
jgi:hypothetical protein